MIIHFTRQLYILIKAGIPLLKALQIICLQLPKGKFKQAIEIIIQDIQEGRSFSDALSPHLKFFSLFYINMIKSAEVSGNLTGILNELSQQLMQHRRISRQVQAAFMYPIFILLTALAILVSLLMFVLPVFVRIFQDLGGNLPTATLFLIGLSRFSLRWGWLLGILLMSLIAVIILLSRNPRGRYLVNTAIWRIPLFGRLIRIMETGRFCRTLGTLLTSGITLIKGLEVLLETTPSALLHRAMENLHYDIQQGKSLSLGMEETGLFPLTLVKMIQVGEESGKLGDLFLEAAEDYENEVSFAITGLLSILEPALIVIMGGIVGFIVVSLFLPIFSLSGLVK